MTHTPPIIELVPLYRCPLCPGRPRLYMASRVNRRVRYFKCRACDYTHKDPRLILVCGSPSFMAAIKAK